MKFLIELLTKKKLTLASCESLTGGLFASIFTETAGISQIFKGGFIVYSNEVKSKLIKVSSNLLEKHGAISKECAEKMATNTRQLLGTNLAISFTGNAGPTSQENKPVGLVYIGLAFKNKVISKNYRFFGSRLDIRKQAIEAGVKLIINNL